MVVVVCKVLHKSRTAVPARQSGIIHDIGVDDDDDERTHTYVLMKWHVSAMYIYASQFCGCAILTFASVQRAIRAIFELHSACVLAAGSEHCIWLLCCCCCSVAIAIPAAMAPIAMASRARWRCRIVSDCDCDCESAR